MPKATNWVRMRITDAESPRSLAGRARARRWEKFRAEFPGLETMRVLDLGGTVEYWQQHGSDCADVTVVNLEPPPPVTGGIRFVQADACSVDLGEFDLVYSNSLVEHVGGHGRRVALADVVRRSAPRWWVQTPYRYFPIEPHWVFPMFQFLPLAAQVAVTRRWPLGHIRERDRDRAVAACVNVDLLSATQMRSLFPGGRIWFERFGGTPKSIVSIKS